MLRLSNLSWEKRNQVVFPNNDGWQQQNTYISNIRSMLLPPPFSLSHLRWITKMHHIPNTNRLHWHIHTTKAKFILHQMILCKHQLIGNYSVLQLCLPLCNATKPHLMIFQMRKSSWYLPFKLISNKLQLHLPGKASHKWHSSFGCFFSIPYQISNQLNYSKKHNKNTLENAFSYSSRSWAVFFSPMYAMQLSLW